MAQSSTPIKQIKSNLEVKEKLLVHSDALIEGHLYLSNIPLLHSMTIRSQEDLITSSAVTLIIPSGTINQLILNNSKLAGRRFNLLNLSTSYVALIGTSGNVFLPPNSIAKITVIAIGCPQQLYTIIQVKHLIVGNIILICPNYYYAIQPGQDLLEFISDFANFIAMTLPGTIIKQVSTNGNTGIFIFQIPGSSSNNPPVIFTLSNGIITISTPPAGNVCSFYENYDGIFTVPGTLCPFTYSLPMSQTLDEIRQGLVNNITTILAASGPSDLSAGLIGDTVVIRNPDGSNYGYIDLALVDTTVYFGVTAFADSSSDQSLCFSTQVYTNFLASPQCTRTLSTTMSFSDVAETLINQITMILTPATHANTIPVSTDTQIIANFIPIGLQGDLEELNVSQVGPNVLVIGQGSTVCSIINRFSSN